MRVECFLFCTSKMHQNTFDGRDRLGPAREFTAISQAPDWIRGELHGRRGRDKGRKEREEERKLAEPQLLQNHVYASAPYRRNMRPTAFKLNSPLKHSSHRNSRCIRTSHRNLEEKNSFTQSNTGKSIFKLAKNRFYDFMHIFQLQNQNPTTKIQKLQVFVDHV